MPTRRMTRKNLAADPATPATSANPPGDQPGTGTQPIAPLQPTQLVRNAESGVGVATGAATGPARRRGNRQHVPHVPLSVDNLLVLAGVADIDVNIPADATLAQVESSMQIAINGVGFFGAALERLKPVIGRHLHHVDVYKLWRGAGYKNFTDYLLRRVVGELHLGETTAWEARAVAKGYPTMTTGEYARFGATRLKDAVDYGITEATPGYRDILEQSLSITAAQFRIILAEREAEETAKTTGRPIGTTPPDTLAGLSIRATAATKALWSAELTASGMTAADLFSAMLNTWIAVKATQPRRAGGNATAVQQAA